MHRAPARVPLGVVSDMEPPLLVVDPIEIGKVPPIRGEASRIKHEHFYDDEPFKGAHSPLLAAGLATVYKISFIPFGAAQLSRQGEHSPRLAAGSIQYFHIKLDDALPIDRGVLPGVTPERAACLFFDKQAPGKGQSVFRYDR